MNQMNKFPTNNLIEKIFIFLTRHHVKHERIIFFWVKHKPKAQTLIESIHFIEKHKLCISNQN